MLTNRTTVIRDKKICHDQPGRLLLVRIWRPGRLSASRYAILHQTHSTLMELDERPNYLTAWLAYWSAMRKLTN